MHGVGTVSSDFLNLCGLWRHPQNHHVMHRPEGTHLDAVGGDESGAAASLKRGTGIAVSIPLSGIQGWLYKVLGSGSLTSPGAGDRKRGEKWSETITHAMILVTINQGYSDDVMYTSARCWCYWRNDLKGSALAVRRRLPNISGMALQEEQEVLAIVVPKDKRTEIMTAISKAARH